MSNNPTPPPPRIEREAKEYTAQFKYGSEYRQTAYLDGGAAEYTRAAPVVKALEKMYKDYHEFMTYKERMDLKQILETYKADQ